MSEEGGSINENTNLTNDGEKATLTPTEHEAASELVSESEDETVAPVTEEGEVGIGETATEEIGGQGEPLEMPEVEQPQLEPQTKPKPRQMQQTITKIQKSLADTSNQIQRQATQISKINQNLQSLQKQMRAEEKQTGTVNQIRSQVNQIQKQISQLHKSVQKRPTSKSQSGKKITSNKKKRNKKNKMR